MTFSCDNIICCSCGDEWECCFPLATGYSKDIAVALNTDATGRPVVKRTLRRIDCLAGVCCICETTRPASNLTGSEDDAHCCFLFCCGRTVPGDLSEGMCSLSFCLGCKGASFVPCCYYNCDSCEFCAPLCCCWDVKLCAHECACVPSIWYSDGACSVCKVRFLHRDVPLVRASPPPVADMK